MRFLVLSLLVCLGGYVKAQNAQVPPELVVEAGHCVATASGDWFDLSRDDPYELELGTVTGGQSGALYLIDFTTPTHSQGFAFAFEAHGKGSHRELELESRTSFRQTVDGTQRANLVDPPLGGIRSHDEILAAIQEVGFHTWKVPVTELRNGSGVVSCRTTGALR